MGPQMGGWSKGDGGGRASCIIYYHLAAANAQTDMEVALFGSRFAPDSNCGLPTPNCHTTQQHPKHF
jgi:hypothetical protein